MPESKKITPEPFIRWAGGKRWLLKHIEELLPEAINNYHEPFLGGGSVFWYLKFSEKIAGNSFLSDSNAELINCYSQICQNCDAIIDILRDYRNEEGFYYEIRATEPQDEISQAARFLYLNATSYNGIYRVNREGRYNVPFGYRKKEVLFDFDNMIRCSSHLDETVNLATNDFGNIMENLTEEDLVFLDPPYTVAHENNGFIEYNQHIFSWEDQERLARLLQQISDNNAYFILTNAAHPSILELFNNLGNMHILQRHSTIGGRGANRSSVNEYVFTNI